LIRGRKRQKSAPEFLFEADDDKEEERLREWVETEIKQKPAAGIHGDQKESDGNKNLDKENPDLVTRLWSTGRDPENLIQGFQS
jgi:hypothetical protein